MIIALLGLGVVSAVAIYFSPWILRQLRTRALRKHLSATRTLVLTYDDGPSPGITTRLVDLLDAHSARASFFMLGSHAEQHAAIADRIARSGHDIGCHSDQHLHAWKVFPSRALTDIAAGYAKLARWIKPHGMFRPPYGKVTILTYYAVRRRGADIWWWTIDSGDTHATLPQPQQVVDRVLSEGGGIVLMHDLDRSDDRNEFVFQTTKLLLEAASQNKLHIRPLSELPA